MTRTPSPWSVYKRKPEAVGNGQWFHIVNNSIGQTVAEVDNESDAQLISAAPDLLDALELILSEFPRNRDGMDGPLPVGIKAARIAFAKATQP